MTIDSSWIACFKEEVPAAFRPTPPFAPTAVFCDGQIKLMPAAIDSVVTWEDYIHRQFAGQIRRYFARGVSCVILAFDDYNHVPAAKSMTQVRLFLISFPPCPYVNCSLGVPCAYPPVVVAQIRYAFAICPA
jgi:hypothetical protein